MESQSKTTFPLRVLVDKEKRRVVAAEATMNFVDILFGFLALPMGTIVRLVEAEQGQHPAVIGCMNNLYNSVEKLGDEVFVNDVRKQMLIRPHNPCDSLCRKLKINVDDSEDVEFYVCISCNYYSTFPNEICTCGQPMIKRKMADHNPGNGVFLRGSPLFLIFDDLKIIPSTPGRSTKLFLQHGYKDLSHLLDINISVGFKEINSLLKYALTSKHPLTSLFLPMKSVEIKSVDPCLCHDQQQQVNTRSKSSIKLKVGFIKSQNKILFAEVTESFAEWLLNFLRLPLGHILSLLDGNSSLGCVDNLYKSVADLDSSWCTLSSSWLRNPGMEQDFHSSTKLFSIVGPQYFYGYGSPFGVCENVVARHSKHLGTTKSLKERPLQFLKRPYAFVVFDDLQVKTLRSTSGVSALKDQNIRFDDFEEQVVSFGFTEALELLRAALNSTTALTSSLHCHLKEAKK